MVQKDRCIKAKIHHLADPVALDKVWLIVPTKTITSVNTHYFD